MKWGGPLAHMMEAKGLIPFLTPLLRARVGNKRTEFGQFVSSVINQAFDLPPDARIELHWSDEIFWDSKTFADLLKTGLAGGPLSQRTFRETGGWDNQREDQRKEDEAAQVKTNREKFAPAFDAAHGDPTTQPGGRPEGGTNADNYNQP